MGHGIGRAGWAGLLVVAFAAGCNAERKPPDDEDGPIRARFAEAQAAVKDRDADQVGALVAEQVHADAERTARQVRAAYAKADPGAKAKQEEALGLTGAELAVLTGKGLLTHRFLRKYRELPDSTVTKVVVGGDNATVYYLEDDGDRKKMDLVREGGAWKVWLTMPAVKLP
jgi:hypothetical protein